jgi:hypothetical protein
MLLNLLVITTLSAILATVVRARRLRKIREQLDRPFEGLPSELVECWGKNRLWNKDRLCKYAPDKSVVAGTVAFTTGKALFHLNRLDGSVLDAVDKIYQPSVENSFAEILDHLREIAGRSDVAWDGVVSLYKGRLGEDYLAEYLDGLGHHVEMASATNQEGWDAVVDGQLVNFKSGTGADHIVEHLERFREIPVITVAEHSTTFADNDMVTCLDNVSGEEIEDSTRNALSSMVEATDFGLDIPFITLALSTARNYGPLLSGYSDFNTATVNTLADTAGIGIGGAAGAKAGAIVGAFGGPLGMFAGTIAGGLIGAIIGGATAQGFKEKALNKAKLEYEEHVRDYEREYTAALKDKALSLEKTAQRYERGFSLRRFFWPMPSDVLCGELKEAYFKWASDCRSYAEELNTQITSDKWEKRPFKDLGMDPNQKGPKEPVYHRKVQHSLALINKGLEKIRSEKRKLGQPI